jgi:hypothetical protein
MSYNTGDVVRIGKGKVEYTVFAHPDTPVNHTRVSSHNTGKGSFVETAKLTLVTAAPVAAPIAVVETVPDVTASPVEKILAVWEVELITSTDDTRRFVLLVDNVPTLFKSFGAAASALVIHKRNGFNHAAIDHNGVRLVTRKAA